MSNRVPTCRLSAVLPGNGDTVIALDMRTEHKIQIQLDTPDVTALFKALSKCKQICIQQCTCNYCTSCCIFIHATRKHAWVAKSLANSSSVQSLPVTPLAPCDVLMHNWYKQTDDSCYSQADKVMVTHLLLMIEWMRWSRMQAP